jgi:hypothetical protein
MRVSCERFEGLRKRPWGAGIMQAPARDLWRLCHGGAFVIRIRDRIMRGCCLFMGMASEQAGRIRLRVRGLTADRVKTQSQRGRESENAY